MKAYAIVLTANKVSQRGYEKLKESNRKFNKFELNVFEAITPDKTEMILTEYNIHWNYPKTGSIIDDNLKLKKTAYANVDVNKRIACALSHYILWHKCINKNKPILILEHDAVFIDSLPDNMIDANFDVLGINDPRNATRKANLFHSLVQQETNIYQRIPKIDSEDIPQGLAGNSAYIVKPNGAKQLVAAVNKYGLWPNDAIMCYQIIKNMYVTKKYYTRVQCLESTTSI
jgi:GR25 family glycosyltransferase involved in LPS biosynthesis